MNLNWLEKNFDILGVNFFITTKEKKMKILYTLLSILEKTKKKFSLLMTSSEYIYDQQQYLV